MMSSISKITGTGTPAALDAAVPVSSGPTRFARVLAGFAGGGIVSALLVMVAASLLRSSWAVPPLPLPAIGPPWGLVGVQVQPAAITVALWLSAVVGGAAVAAGLVAVHRGVRPSIRLLVTVAVIAVVVLTVLPPVGSTDALDYAVYGRIMALGHSPYVEVPNQLRIAHNAFAQSVPVKWDQSPSVYGPLATLEQFLAAKLGGASPARIIFWLKLWNAIAFGVVAFAADRRLRSDLAMRLRAHLLWTVNPLLWWSLIAAGHVDVIAAALGLLGLLLLRGPILPGTILGGLARSGPEFRLAGSANRAAPPKLKPGWKSVGARMQLSRVLAAGALLGATADIKINYALFGLALAWVLRRSPAALAAAAVGAFGVLIPSYALFGLPALKAVAVRGNADNFYGLLFYPRLVYRTQIAVIAVIAVILVSLLLLRRLPVGPPGSPAIRSALALTVSWLFFWPYQLPWYEAMIICLLVLYPRTRLDWLVLARLTVATLSSMPGNPTFPRGSSLTIQNRYNVLIITPAVLFAVCISVVLLAVTRRWQRRPAKPGLAKLRPVKLGQEGSNSLEAGKGRGPAAADLSDAPDNAAVL